MKHLNEAVGVPKNIIPVAKEIEVLLAEFVEKIKDPYQKTSETFNKLDLSIASENNSKQTKIDQVKFSYHPITNLHPLKDPCGCIGISIDREQRIKGNKIIFAGPRNSLHINIYLKFHSKECSKDQVSECILNYCTVSVIAHELKHKFDVDANNTIEFKKFLDYQAKARALMDPSDILTIRAFSEFLFNSYFVSDIESSVYAVELAAEMSEQKTKKAEFYKFLKSTSIYQTLLNCRNYVYESFYIKLSEDQDVIENLLEVNGIDSNVSNEQIAKEAIKLFFQEISKASEKEIKSLCKGEDQERFLREFQKEARKYQDNPFAYFKKACDEISQKGEKIFKKIAKIYSLAESVEPRLHCAFLVDPRPLNVTFADYYKSKQKNNS